MDCALVAWDVPSQTWACGLRPCGLTKFGQKTAERARVKASGDATTSWRNADSCSVGIGSIISGSVFSRGRGQQAAGSISVCSGAEDSRQWAAAALAASAAAAASAAGTEGVVGGCSVCSTWGKQWHSASTARQRLGAAMAQWPWQLRQRQRQWQRQCQHPPTSSSSSSSSSSQPPLLLAVVIIVLVGNVADMSADMSRHAKMSRHFADMTLSPTSFF